MTRGKFILITDDGMYISPECNGDMYYATGSEENFIYGNGKKGSEMLNDVSSLREFESMLKKFNEEFPYFEDEEEITSLTFRPFPDPNSSPKGSLKGEAIVVPSSHESQILFQVQRISFSHDTYFDEWFSDYLYIKNISSLPIELLLSSSKKGEGERKKYLMPSCMCSIYFGELFDFKNPLSMVKDSL